MPRAIPVIVACLFLAAAAWQAYGSVAFLRVAERTTGRVIDPGPGGRHARIEFVLSDGRAVTFQSHGLITSVHMGQTVPVAYASSSPAASARVAWLIPTFFVPAILALIGAGIMALALASRI